MDNIEGKGGGDDTEGEVGTSHVAEIVCSRVHLWLTDPVIWGSCLQYAINARGGGYNGGLVDMKDTEYSSSSFWQKTHNWPVDLSDEDI